MKLTLLDLTIVALPLLLMVGLTLYLRRFMTGVSDFLAAGRGAGRYLIATSSGEVAAGVLGLVAAMEVFSRAGFSIQLWGGFTGVLYLFIVISGYFSYRLRETRVLTLHQFIEVRYSRKLRVFASMLTFFSGAFFYGVVPGVSARFFVNFLGLPAATPLFGYAVPTFGLIMIAMLALALFFTVTSGQIGVLVTDSLEFIISLVMYLVVVVVILGVCSTPLVTLPQMEAALLSGPAGGSFIDPLDIGARSDFDYFYVLIGFLLMTYNFRGSTNSTSAASAHEGRMAGILGTWRGVGTGAMTALLAVSAFTLLKHTDFVAMQASVERTLALLPSEQLRTQMRMPAALGELLPTGARGCFLVIAILGTVAGLGAYCMQMGSTFIQDVVLPLRGGQSLEPKRQVRWLRLSVIGFGMFTVCFSLFYKPADYLQMLMLLIGSIYLGGAGVVFIGGLYWKRGTTQGAWAALVSGAVLALTGWGAQAFWPDLAPGLAGWLGEGGWGDAVRAQAGRWPINGQIMSLITALTCIVVYVAVSLLTCRLPHDMDKLFHRGPYAVKEDQASVAPAARVPRHWLARFLHIDEHYTRGDRFLAYTVFLYALTWNLAFIGAMLWNVLIERWPAHWWWKYVLVQNIILPLVICVINTVWFSAGALRDLLALRRKLREVRADDDGQVRAEVKVIAAKNPTNCL